MTNNSRLLVIQKIYEKITNTDENISFPKNAYIRIIKKVFNGFFEKDTELDIVLQDNLSSNISLKNLIIVYF